MFIRIFFSCLILAFLISSASCGQSKQPLARQRDVLEAKMLKGKWKSEADPKVVLIFGEHNYLQVYGNDTISTLWYTFSSSCDLKDSILRINLRPASFLIMYSREGKIDQCNEILGLGNILSLTDQKMESCPFLIE
jgi:hypothetical protein